MLAADDAASFGCRQIRCAVERLFEPADVVRPVVHAQKLKCLDVQAHAGMIFEKVPGQSRDVLAMGPQRRDSNRLGTEAGSDVLTKRADVTVGRRNDPYLDTASLRSA